MGDWNSIWPLQSTKSFSSTLKLSSGKPLVQQASSGVVPLKCATLQNPIVVELYLRRCIIIYIKDMAGMKDNLVSVSRLDVDIVLGSTAEQYDGP